MEIALQFVTASWQVLGEMSPYLLLGFLVAGVLSVCISPAWVERHLGGRGLRPIFMASIFGVPLPLCSCGVIPVAASVRHHGASRGATSAFLLSTPQTGVDSIAATWALLGPVFAIFRPIAALLTGVLGGVLIRYFGEQDLKDVEEESNEPCAEACCEGRGETNVLVRIFRYGFLTLPRDIGTALLIGIVIAGAMAALIPENELKPYVQVEILSILFLMAVGVPLYTCATASVPLAAGFIFMGFSPGAAFAFLVTGPATNAATVTTIWKVMGKRTAVLYLLTVVISAVLGGLALNWTVDLVGFPLPKLDEHGHHESPIWQWVTHGSAVLLLLVLGVSYLVKPSHHHEESDDDHDHAHGHGSKKQRVALSITGMNCSHCSETVRRSLSECDGVESVEVDLASGQAIVVGGELDPEQLTEAVEGGGYGSQVLGLQKEDGG